MNQKEFDAICRKVDKRIDALTGALIEARRLGLTPSLKLRPYVLLDGNVMVFPIYRLGWEAEAYDGDDDDEPTDATPDTGAADE